MVEQEIHPKVGQALSLTVTVISVRYVKDEIRVRYQERYSGTKFTLKYKQQELE